MRQIDGDKLLEHVYFDDLDTREKIAEMIQNAPEVKQIWSMPPHEAFLEIVKHTSNLEALAELTSYLTAYLEARGMYEKSFCNFALRLAADRV